MSDLPRSYVTGRLLIVVPALAIIVLACAGFAGWGPGGALRATATEPAIHWVTGQTDRDQAKRREAVRRKRREERHRKRHAERHKKRHEKKEKRRRHHKERNSR
jgi:hypothetical protein